MQHAGHRILWVAAFLAGVALIVWDAVTFAEHLGVAWFGYAGVRLDQNPVPPFHKTRLRNRGTVHVLGGTFTRVLP